MPDIISSAIPFTSTKIEDFNFSTIASSCVLTSLPTSINSRNLRWLIEPWIDLFGEVMLSSIACSNWTQFKNSFKLGLLYFNLRWRVFTLGLCESRLLNRSLKTRINFVFCFFSSFFFPTIRI